MTAHRAVSAVYTEWPQTSLRGESDARPVALAVASGDRSPSASFGPQNISVTYDKGDVSMCDIAEPGSGGLGA